MCIADENPGAGASSRAGGSLTLTDDESAGAGRLQLVVASNKAITVFDDRFKLRAPAPRPSASHDQNELHRRYEFPK
jgi:hypothetical protein